MDFAYITLIISHDAQCRVTLNAFPLLDEVCNARMQWMDILNSFMMAENTLEISITAQDPQTELTARLRLSRHSTGGIVSSETGRALTATMQNPTGMPIPQELDGVFNLSETGQVQALSRFRSHGPDFSARLRPDRALDSAKALTVAEGILDDLQRGDIDAVIKLMAPDLQDSALVWETPVSEARNEERAGLTMIGRGPQPGPDGYNLTSEQIGPLVRVLRDGGPLLRSRNGKITRHVILGWSDGKVAILR
ncbi:hypothetical protein [Roseovarius sp.]|uniref:hypothetical protein n=1 Tax=Roseovarius sp. TaxID=1486281 RepID=UPI0035612D37